MENLTPAQKREQTMVARYGKDWRIVVGQRAKEAREAKHGVEQYSKAGVKGGGKPRPNSRPFKKDRDLASRAGKKGSTNRWGK